MESQIPAIRDITRFSGTYGESTHEMKLMLIAATGCCVVEPKKGPITLHYSRSYLSYDKNYGTYENVIKCTHPFFQALMDTIDPNCTMYIYELPDSISILDATKIRGINKIVYWIGGITALEFFEKCGIEARCLQK